MGLISRVSSRTYRTSMPLCIVSGRPFSGKTHLSGQLKTFLEARPDKPYENVILISDEDSYAELNLPRDQVYESTHVLEKRLRGNLKAETEKALASPKNLVILDHGNYIKSFRYELYCLAKSTKEKSCCLYLSSSLVPESSKCQNPYSDEIFEALTFRFEQPNGNNRWDKPLIAVDSAKGQDIEAHFQQVVDCLYDRGTSVKPNNSTVAPAEANLADMEKITQNIVDVILKARKDNQSRVELPNKVIIDTPSSFRKTDNDIRRSRREFSKYIKAQFGNANKQRSNDEITALFVQYLDSSIS